MFKLAIFLAAVALVAIYPAGMVGIIFLTIVTLAIENAVTSSGGPSVSPAGDEQ